MLVLTFLICSAVLIIYGSALISNGVLLGCLTILGFVLICARIPGFANLARRAPILFEFGGALLTYLILGGSTTGMIAAAVAGIGITSLLGLPGSPPSEEYTQQNTQA